MKNIRVTLNTAFDGQLTIRRTSNKVSDVEFCGHYSTTTCTPIEVLKVIPLLKDNLLVNLGERRSEINKQIQSIENFDALEMMILAESQTDK